MTVVMLARSPSRITVGFMVMVVCLKLRAEGAGVGSGKF